MPQEGDIHAVLKYLALVMPNCDKSPEIPDDLGSFQIVFSGDLERMVSLGWGSGDERSARLLGPQDLRAMPHHSASTL